MPAIPGNVIIMLPEESALCSQYTQWCNHWHGPKYKATCCKL